MSKMSKKLKKSTETREELPVDEEFQENPGSKAPEEANTLGKALEADEKKATKGSEKKRKDKASGEAIEEKSEATAAEDELLQIAGRHAPKKRQSTGNASASNTVEKTTTLEGKKKNKKFLIPRFSTEEENPLSILKPLSSEMAQMIAEQTFEEPFIEPIDLTTLRNVGEYRVGDYIRIRTDEMRAETYERNESIAHFNWLRAIKFLDELRAGTHDIYCDNLAQYELVQEVINDQRKLKRQQAKEAKANKDEISSAYMHHLRKMTADNKANKSSSKTTATSNPSGTGSTPSRSGSNPFLAGFNPSSPNPFSAGPDGKRNPSPDRRKSFPRPEGEKGVPNPKGYAPNDISSGQDYPMDEETWSGGSTSNKDTNSQQDQPDDQGEEFEQNSPDDKKGDRDGQHTLFGSETRNTIVMSHSLVKLAPLIQENDKDLTLEMVQKFVDTCRRAIANGQPINVLSLIPPNHQTVIDFRLMAWQRPPIRATKTPEQLFQNLFLLVGPQTAKALSVDEQMATFFKDVSCYLSQHDYNPPTQVTMTRIIHELQRLQQEHGLSSDLNLLRFTKEESSSCLREVLTALETRVRKNPNENKRIASLYKYLTRQSTGTEFRGLQKAPETLADLCAALMNFAVECDRLTAIVQDLGRAPTTKRHQENLGGGKSGYEKIPRDIRLSGPPRLNRACTRFNLKKNRRDARSVIDLIINRRNAPSARVRLLETCTHWLTN